MAKSPTVRDVDPVVVPIPDNEELGSMDEWLKSLRGPGEPTELSRPTYELLDEARSEAE